LKRSGRSQTTQHQTNHDDIDHGFTGLRIVFIVLTQAAIEAEPAEGALANPASGEDLEAFHQRIGQGDFDGPVTNTLDPLRKLAPIGAVGPDQAQARKQAGDHQQEANARCPVMHIGFRHQGFQHQALRIGQDMPFAAFDELAAVEAAKPPFSAVLTDWLSRMAPLGVGARPAAWRTCSRKCVLIRSHRPFLRQVLK